MKPLKTKVAVIGSGPVGLLASLLLEHYKIPYQTFEKYPSFRAHPSAHWITARSKQILSQIPGLVQKLDSIQQNWSNFTHYRYVQKIGGYQLGAMNHFTPSVDQRLSLSRKNFGGQIPNHIPQNVLLETMSTFLKDKSVVNFNQQIKGITENQGNTVKTHKLVNSSNQIVAEAQYIIISNGVNSNLRDSLKIPILNKKVHMNIHNIYFKSKKLAALICQSKQNAMLHFIYNDNIPGVLVNHSINQGIFVAQIPNFQPFVNLLHFYMPVDLLRNLFSEQINRYLEASDIQILHVGNWTAQQLLTNMRKGNILIAGDTGHSIPPSGGFGMNCGFQDIHEAVHAMRAIKIIQACNGSIKNSSVDIILNAYQKNRVKINQKYIHQAMKNFRTVDKIAAQVGLQQRILQLLHYQPIKNPVTTFLNLFPKGISEKKEYIRKGFMKLSYKRGKIQNPNLQLFFDDFQLRENPISASAQEIIAFNRNNADSKKLFWLKKRKFQGRVEKIGKFVGLLNTQKILKKNTLKIRKFTGIQDIPEQAVGYLDDLSDKEGERLVNSNCVIVSPRKSRSEGYYGSGGETFDWDDSDGDGDGDD